MSNYLNEVITELGLKHENVSVSPQGVYAGGIFVTPIYNGVLIIEPYKPNRTEYNRAVRAKLIRLITDKPMLNRELVEVVHNLVYECSGDPVTESVINIDHDYTITVSTPDYEYLINTKSKQTYVNTHGSWEPKSPKEDLTHVFDDIVGLCVLLNVPTVPGYNVSYF